MKPKIGRGGESPFKGVKIFFLVNRVTKNTHFPLFFIAKWTNFGVPIFFFRILSDFNESF